MDGSDHRNHTVLVGVRRVRDINYKAGFTIVARLATYRQVHKYTGMNLPLIGRRVRRRARDPSSGRLQCPAAIKARRAWLVRSDSANAVKTHLRHLYATSARTAATRPCSAPGPSACSQGPPAGPRTPVGPAWGQKPSRAGRLRRLPVAAVQRTSRTRTAAKCRHMTTVYRPAGAVSLRCARSRARQAA